MTQNWVGALTTSYVSTFDLHMTRPSSTVYQDFTDCGTNAYNSKMYQSTNYYKISGILNKRLNSKWY